MKTGYLISKNRAIDAFFTTASAYDRPRWTSLAEATVYPTAELAQIAAKKLYKNGAYEARIVSLSEAISFSMPDEDADAGIGGSTDLPAIDGEGDPALELGADPSADPSAEQDADSEMVASDQEEGPCQKCEHEPCTCDNGENDPDQSEDGADDIQADVDQALGDESGEVDATPDVNASDVNLDLDGEEDLPPVRESTPEVKIKDKNPADPDDAGLAGPVAGANDDKVTVPANIKSELKAVIAKFKKEAETYERRDDARASFAMTVEDAFTTLLDDLELGTVAGIKQAQVHMTSWMSVITANLPTSVIKFITRGGKKPSLKDLFDGARTSSRGLFEKTESIDQLKVKLAKAKEDLADMKSNPKTQAGYDALDDARAEVAALERKIKAAK